MKKEYSVLFTPLKINGVTLKNRIAMPAMDTNYAGLDGSFQRKHYEYFVNRARGGLGLIYTEAVSVSWPEGKISERQLRFNSDDATTDLREMTDSVHAFGTKIIAQLHHGGFMAVPEYCEDMPGIAPSEANGAREMTIEDIHRVEHDFIHAAKIAQKAGFDGIELHAAHMYLLNQFISPASNKRTDEYGGSKENRFRIIREIIEGIKDVCPSPFIIDVRLGVVDFVPDGNTLEDGVKFAKLCEQAGADMINCSVGMYSVMETEPTQWDDEGTFVYMSEAVKKAVNIPVAIVGKLRTPGFCSSVLNENKADILCIGRQNICDPSWTNKVLQGKEETIRPCLNCLDGCLGQFYFNHGTIHCTLNPYVGNEDIFNEFNIPKTGRPGKIAVVGGGVAGMQFAIISKRRGNDVVLIEKADRLGGQMILAGKTPLKADVNNALEWFKAETERTGVDIRLNTEATPELIKSLGADKAVLAMGAEPSFPPIDGIENAVDGWKVIDDKYDIPSGSKAVIIGGGVVGSELAHKLVEAGVNVTILEMLSDICIGHEFAHRMLLVDYLNKYADVNVSANVIKIEKNSVTFIDKDGTENVKDADTVICTTGQHSVSGQLYQALLDEHVETYKISDWVNPSNIRIATRSALELAYTI
ncbi:MAG: FAD-dependent oxidoreductase [Eubacteriaceae bacterium]|jgi:2,4-dienoyl-CoA reductase-like NADH-dependent reductase (Old Yellow Enzyme family)/thioredoxin reductase|nr:FAD-dependent oxidoreductase [Eubacteriaceae bacterium]